MQKLGLNYWVSGIVVAMIIAAAPVNASVPITFDTTASVTLQAHSYESASNSGNNYANCSLAGGTDPHCYNGSGTISCNSSTGSPATIVMSGHGGVNHGGLFSGTFSVYGDITIGTTSSCPAGTPVMLSVSSVYTNMFDEFPMPDSYFELYSGGTQSPQYYYEDIAPPTSPLEIPLYAGDTINIHLYSYVDSQFSEWGNYGCNATINFACEVVPEPASLALLALGGLITIRRR